MQACCAYPELDGVPGPAFAKRMQEADEEDLHEYYCALVWDVGREVAQGGFEQWIHDCPDDEHTPEAYVAHDLHSVHRFDREDARKALGRKWTQAHQGLQIRDALRAFLGHTCVVCDKLLMDEDIESDHGDLCCSESCREDADLRLDRLMPEDDWRLSR